MKVLRLNVDDISRQLGGNYFMQKRVYVRGGGHGLFSRLFRFAIPYIQKAGKYFLKRGVDVAESGLAHYAQGNNIKDSFKEGAKRAYDKTRADLDKVIGSGGIRKRKVHYKKLFPK
jgi:hypothetical protein